MPWPINALYVLISVLCFTLGGLLTREAQLLRRAVKAGPVVMGTIGRITGSGLRYRWANGVTRDGQPFSCCVSLLSRPGAELRLVQVRGRWTRIFGGQVPLLMSGAVILLVLALSTCIAVLVWKFPVR